MGLSADVTSCSPARRVPERGTSPPAPSSATFQVSIRREVSEGRAGGGPVEGGRRKGWGGFCGAAKGANRLGSGHCPENSASNLPLIKPPPPTTRSITQRGWSQPCGDKRGPWARLAGDHTAARLLRPHSQYQPQWLVIFDSPCPPPNPSSATVAPWFSTRRTVRVTYH